MANWEYFIYSKSGRYSPENIATTLISRGYENGINCKAITKQEINRDHFMILGERFEENINIPQGKEGIMFSSGNGNEKDIKNIFNLFQRSDIEVKLNYKFGDIDYKEYFEDAPLEINGKTYFAGLKSEKEMMSQSHTPGMHFSNQKEFEHFTRFNDTRYHFYNCTFDDIHFSDNVVIGQLEKCRFNRCTFENFDAESINFNNSVLTDCNIINSNFKNCNFESVELYQSQISKSDFTNANFATANIKRTRFDENNLSAVKFHGATLNGVIITEPTINIPIEGLYDENITWDGATYEEIETLKKNIFSKLKLEPASLVQELGKAANSLEPLNVQTKEMDFQKLHLNKLQAIAEYEQKLNVSPEERIVEMNYSTAHWQSKDNISPDQAEAVYNHITDNQRIGFERANEIRHSVGQIPLTADEYYGNIKNMAYVSRFDFGDENSIDIEAINKALEEVPTEYVLSKMTEEQQNLFADYYEASIDFAVNSEVNLSAADKQLYDDIINIRKNNLSTVKEPSNNILNKSYTQTLLNEEPLWKVGESNTFSYRDENFILKKENVGNREVYSIYKDETATPLYQYDSMETVLINFIIDNQIDKSIYSGEVSVYFDGDNVSITDKYNHRIKLQPADNYSYNNFVEYLNGISEMYPEYRLFIKNNIAEIIRDYNNALQAVSDEAKSVRLAQLEADMYEGGGYGEDNANARAEAEISHLREDLNNTDSPELKNSKIRFKILKADPITGYKYNVQVHFSHGFHENFVYSGMGRFCKNPEEVKKYINKIIKEYSEYEYQFSYKDIDKNEFFKSQDDLIYNNSFSNEILESKVTPETKQFSELPKIDIENKPLSKEEFDKLTSEIKNIAATYQFDPELLTDYLAFKAQFYQYSPTNTMLIHLQNPHATFVGSYTFWKNKGYGIKKGQHHIKISRPIETSRFPKEINGKTVWTDIKYASSEEKAKIAEGKLEIKKTTKFIPHQVFDISQTTCPVEDYPKFYNMGHPDMEQNQLYECVKQYAKECGFTVTEEDLSSISLHGYYSKTDDSIHINSLLEDSKRLETMCHELAHGVLHKTTTQPVEISEFEAECFGTMLKRKMGFPVSEESKRYINQYFTKSKLLENSKFDIDKTLNRLSKTFNHVSKGIETTMSDMGFAPEREIAQNLSQAKSNAINPIKISENFTQALS